MPPNCHPLSEQNILVVAPGLLAGTALSSANRLSAGAKSPLTGGIKESNSGGVVAYMGETGEASAPHLHFEIWRDGEAVDPREFLRGDPPRQ